MLAALIAAVVLLREVLLPFVAGMVLAYLLDPLATRLERLGMNRLIATLTIVGLFIGGVVALIVLTAPIIVRELAYSSTISRSTSGHSHSRASTPSATRWTASGMSYR